VGEAYRKGVKRDKGSVLVRHIKHGGVRAFAISILTFVSILSTMPRHHSVPSETVMKLSFLSLNMAEPSN
jgi:hypothetical protein